MLEKELLWNLSPDTNCDHLWNLDSQLLKGEIISSILTKHKIIQLKNVKRILSTDKLELELLF